MASDYGYAGKIVLVDLSTARVTTVATSDYAERFVGGKGIAAKIYWDQVPANADPLGPESALICMTGPFAGVPGIPGSRWLMCGKTPVSYLNHFSCCSLGGRWGAQLKFAGYDGLVVHGKSEKPVYLLIEPEAVEIRDASFLWGRDSAETRETLKAELGNGAAVVATGPAGENLVSAASVLADQDAAGSSFGALMGSKKLKAVAVRGGERQQRVADPLEFEKLTEHFRRAKGNGSREFATQMKMAPPPGGPFKQQFCYGCRTGCDRMAYTTQDGDKGKCFCQASIFYFPYLMPYYHGEPGDIPFHLAHMCDTLGLDTKFLEPLVTWLAKCHEAGILTDENTGLPLSKLGSFEFAERLIHKIVFREGFGDVLANGLLQAAEQVGSESQALLTDYASKAGTSVAYSGRMYIQNGLLLATELKPAITQIHQACRRIIMWRNWRNGDEGTYMSSEVVRGIAKKFWGGELAADFSTYEGKALAAKMVQDRDYAVDTLTLCGQMFPVLNLEYTEDHIGDPEMEGKLYAAVTGKTLDEHGGTDGLGERVFNLHRAILVREGHKGREEDKLEEFEFTEPLQADIGNPECIAPGKDGEPISRKGEVLDREKFRQIQDEYYELRRWDVRTGLQTTAVLDDLGLGDVANQLEQSGLAV